jgi:glycerol kinase
MTAILALDQGTTGTKAYVWRDACLRPVGRFMHRQIRPRPGWVEHDPAEILGQLRSLVDAAGPVAYVGLANQGETVIAWDAATLRPLHNALVWQDERTGGDIETLRAAGVESLTRARAGLPLDAYFSATKLRWLLDNADGARGLRAQGRLRLGTSDAFFLHALTGHCATDASTASRTSLMNLRTLAWDPDLCGAFGVPIECLPEIRSTTADFGCLPRGGRVVASVVDQQAALFGHGCGDAGDMKITFGTGAFALALCDGRPEHVPEDGLLPTCAWRLGDGQARYALDGGILTAGGAVDWLGELGLRSGHAELDGFSGPSAIERGIVFVPALAGLGCPHWDRAARGCWLGLDLATGAADLRRAVLEGIALRSAELVRALEARLGGVRRIGIDGGLSRSAFFNRFLAAALCRTIDVAGSADMTALGVLHLCLAAAGRDERPGPGNALRVEPEAPLHAGLHERFARAVALSRSWAER